MSYPIKRYRKVELARLNEVSLKTFMKELNPILEQLIATGYRKTQKHFTPKQVRIIILHLEGNTDNPGE